MKNPKSRFHFSFVLLIFCSLPFGTAFGQSASVSGAITANTWAWPHPAKVPAANSPLLPQSDDIAISYYDPATPTHSWLAPSNWGVEVLAFTERITLPADSGYVDSVRIVFNTIGGDSVAVVLDPDTVIAGPSGFNEHLDETAFDNSVNAYGVAGIYPSQLHSDTVTVAFAHIPVPKNFHVTLVPSFNQSNGSLTAFYAVRGDSEATRVRTVDNCHSSFIAVNLSSGQSESGVIDSNLTPAGDVAPLYSNLYITAYVSAAPSSVASTPTSSAISIFPNPAATSIQIQGAASISNVELLDLLGRTVLSSRLNGNKSLNVSGLEPGRYEAVVHTTDGLQAEPLLIQR